MRFACSLYVLREGIILEVSQRDIAKAQREHVMMHAGFRPFLELLEVALHVLGDERRTPSGTFLHVHELSHRASLMYDGDSQILIMIFILSFKKQLVDEEIFLQKNQLTLIKWHVFVGQFDDVSFDEAQKC